MRYARANLVGVPQDEEELVISPGVNVGKDALTSTGSLSHADSSRSLVASPFPPPISIMKRFPSSQKGN